MANVEDIAGRFLVPSILRSTDNAYRFWSSFKEFDPKVDQLYNSLVRERAILQKWVAQMNAAGYNGTSFLLGVKWRDVHVLLVELQQYMTEAEGRYASINETVVDSQREVSKYLVKIKFTKTSYNDLNDIVGTMRKINKRLSAISPPPPPYIQEPLSVGLDRSQERSGTLAAKLHEANTKLAQIDEASHQASVSISSNFQNRLNQTVESDSSGVSTPGRQTAQVLGSSHMYSSMSSIDQERQKRKQSIVETALDETLLNLQEVYSLCLRSLKCIAMSDDVCRTLAQLVRSRLKLWGVGLFEGTASLDILLRNEKLNCDRTRELLNKYMIVLLSHIDVVLKSIFESQKRTASEIVSALVEVQSLLSSDAAQTYILKQWQINFDANPTYGITDTDSEAGQALEQEHTDETRSFGHDQDILPNSEARKMQHLQAASRLIETFFQLLPVFEILRSKSWHITSRAVANRVESTVSAQYVSLVSRMRTMKPSQTNLDIVQRYIADRDEHIQREDRKAVLFGPLFKKQQERFEEYKWSIGTQRQAEVDKQIEALLASVVQDIQSKNLQPDSKILQPQWKMSGKSTDTLNEDASKFDKKEQDMMLKELVESFEQILMR